MILDYSNHFKDSSKNSIPLLSAKIANVLHLMILNSKHLHVNLNLNYYFINFPRLASHFDSDIPIIF